MSKRELRALVGAEDPSLPSPEAQPQAEAGETEEGHAKAARLTRVGAEIEEELERARESARPLRRGTRTSVLDIAATDAQMAGRTEA